jgi:hypothetical protein
MDTSDFSVMTDLEHFKKRREDGRLGRSRITTDEVKKARKEGEKGAFTDAKYNRKQVIVNNQRFIFGEDRKTAITVIPHFTEKEKELMGKLEKNEIEIIDLKMEIETLKNETISTNENLNNKETQNQTLKNKNNWLTQKIAKKYKKVKNTKLLEFKKCDTNEEKFQKMKEFKNLEISRLKEEKQKLENERLNRKDEELRLTTQDQRKKEKELKTKYDKEWRE